ncbi:MAG: hypothetical protein AAB395_01315 [Patescibacteria group bacterium]
MRSLNADYGPRTSGELKPKSDEALIAFLGSSGIFGFGEATESQLNVPNKEIPLKDERASLRQQDKLILDELWSGLMLGLVTNEQIQDFTGKTLFELEYLAILDPGCLQGFFAATQTETSVDYFVPTRAKA